MKITKLLCTLTLAAAPLLALADDDSISLVENGTFKKNGMGWEAITKDECGQVEYIQEEEDSYARLTPVDSKYPHILITQRSFVPSEGGEFVASAKSVSVRIMIWINHPLFISMFSILQARNPAPNNSASSPPSLRSPGNGLMSRFRSPFRRRAPASTSSAPLTARPARLISLKSA